MRGNLERETLGGSGATRDFKREREGIDQRQHKSYFHGLDKIATSFFITDFPPEVNSGELWKTFAKYGKVGEVYIPKKLTKWGKRFGFVKFKEVVNVEELEGKVKNVRCGEVKIRVNLARFGREGEAASEKVTAIIQNVCVFFIVLQIFILNNLYCKYY